MRFKDNAGEIIKKAHSIKWMAGAFIFTVLEVALPYFQGWLPVPDQFFGVLSGVCVAGAFLTRLMVQQDLLNG